MVYVLGWKAGRYKRKRRRQTRYAARKLAVERAEKIDPVNLEKRKAQAKWGREVEVARKNEERRAAAHGSCAHPTRAHVLGLKKFWEGVIRAAAAG
ncbi:hypothetical protein LTS07_002502 [Exophiala sideris]|uniref:Uncharacterized protein n=1 Tax=Exophiala sideris TaxID=1016849 RepID=A0ABR0JJ40_9EURO|nr:hypothetical protein LTR13_008296 [Exophiala sideris]KAK5035067.1 hypothetical protein LTS07_002502 [Exophiala sideris]KAK5065990.1 hypothetical protein LTR69_002507 [Exophiala sideris]KAK5178342.1 hypothetical protein LTR44_009218 [Eurotiomycetes sp. CCFEE 6388]